MDQPFLEMKLSEFQRICQSLGIEAAYGEQHYPLVLEMFWDGFCPAEVLEMVEVIRDRDHYSYIPSL